ncbi:hypothetical protein EJ04DRAFT_29636 [Polyplosphaeria fusca]|uniref:Uncharacterized protein n=1 Tax=Polyplosphaeria fusca TaxID=682080 RepID=A0A9P4QTW1_9PLEO|nr:hypothetical protein EJ04DRAFT_29636 [Polyplosphaeria fusca]
MAVCETLESRAQHRQSMTARVVSSGGNRGSSTSKRTQVPAHHSILASYWRAVLVDRLDGAAWSRSLAGQSCWTRERTAERAWSSWRKPDNCRSKRSLTRGLLRGNVSWLLNSTALEAGQHHSQSSSARPRTRYAAAFLILDHLCLSIRIIDSTKSEAADAANALVVSDTGMCMVRAEPQLRFGDSRWLFKVPCIANTIARTDRTKGLVV